MKPDKIHYSGGLRIFNERGGVTQMSADYPCCSYGEYATKITKKGNHTADPDQVTCLACRKYITRARENGVVGTGVRGRVPIGEPPPKGTT